MGGAQKPRERGELRAAHSPRQLYLCRRAYAALPPRTTRFTMPERLRQTALRSESTEMHIPNESESEALARTPSARCLQEDVGRGVRERGRTRLAATSSEERPRAARRRGPQHERAERRETSTYLQALHDRLRGGTSCHNSQQSRPCAQSRLEADAGYGQIGSQYGVERASGAGRASRLARCRTSTTQAGVRQRGTRTAHPTDRTHEGSCTLPSFESVVFIDGTTCLLLKWSISVMGENGEPTTNPETGMSPPMPGVERMRAGN